MKIEESPTPAPTTENPQGEPKIVEIKLPGGETTTAKKKKKKSDPAPIMKDADPILKSNISALIGTINKLAAVRLGGVWEFHETEIEAIADPAARLFERHGFGDAAGKYSDYFMLTLAIGLPIGLRLLVTTNQPKREGGLKLAETPRPGTAATAGNDPERKANSNSADHGKKTPDSLTVVLDERINALADSF